jgi:hypothetical protein
MKKVCSKCYIEKDLSFFYKDHTKLDGFYSSCKHCKKVYSEYNKEKINKKQTLYNAAHRDVINLKMKDYGKRNRVLIAKQERERLHSDMNFKIRKTLRSRLWHAIKNTQKSGSAIADLGCSVEFLKTYLENQFQSGMTWENYGEWHIDHLRPLSKFDLSDRQQFLAANHYSNLRPLWAVDNIRKGNKYE